MDEALRSEASEEISQAAIRARDLVRQLLAFGRKQTLQLEDVDLNALLRRFEELLRHSIREDIALRWSLDPSLPAIRGDAGQLEQVVMNLAINAQDAMPDGGTLHIETATEQVEAGSVEEAKPFTVGVLADRVRQTLDGGTSGRG